MKRVRPRLARSALLAGEAEEERADGGGDAGDADGVDLVGVVGGGVHRAVVGRPEGDRGDAGLVEGPVVAALFVGVLVDVAADGETDGLQRLGGLGTERRLLR